MNGIECCADCGYYDSGKHKCTRGCTVDPDISKGQDVRFYVDCPLPDVQEVRHGRWAKAADKQYCTNCRAVTKVCNAPFCWHCGSQMDLRTPTEVQLDEADSVIMGGADNVSNM